MKAWINWNNAEQAWILRLWANDTQGWVFSKAWRSKDEGDDGVGFVHESIVCEIAWLQDMGYDVQVTVGR